LPAMKIWIDILTPKQVNLFSIFTKRLAEQGHEVFLTARHYRELEQLLQIRGMNAKIVGRHGGGDLTNKLLESSKRVTELVRHVANQNPQLAISFCSPEAARVAYGLRIPHYAICDSPHAESVCRLSLPLSKRLFTPRVIPKSAWRQYGISSSKIVRYNALDPAAWIRYYASTSDMRSSMGLDEHKPVVVLRTEEEYASYLQQDQRPTKSIITQLVRPVTELGAQVVVMPRYEEQVETLTRDLSGMGEVLPRVIDAIRLLSCTSFFVGAGGTMCAEAALMGVPTVSCYPSKPTYVDRYLCKLGLLERTLSPSEIVDRIRRCLDHPEIAVNQKTRASRLLARMEDPVSVIMSHLGLSGK